MCIDDVIGGVSAANSVISGAKVPRQCRSGESVHFLVQTRDSYNNNQLNGGASVTVQLKGAAQYTGNVRDCGDGSYVIDCNPTKAGDYEVFVDVNGQSIAGSPFVMTVLPGMCIASFFFILSTDICDRSRCCGTMQNEYISGAKREGRNESQLAYCSHG